ncbi:DUF317 domain-containing protein [Streptomyces sp. SID8366]|uniref:DUF317 domain-containing protein n=1 Tax=Streptomyces sp. SID69 TaxID=2690323 RepID=UPI00136AD777|nr:DUF317 domain-containing protein [Streptomyces sp. SID8366]MYU61730.1 DUF317 domain-containing protein [Streptomyces sp. SID69]
MTRPYIHTRANDPRGLIWYETRPRHLAGPGDPRRITRTLRAAGWTNLSIPDYPHVVLASPDQQLTLVLEPQPGPYGSWWHLRSQQGRWTAEFGANTLVEMIAALTDAVLEPEPAASTPEIWPMLTTAGWRYERGEHANESATHPDGRLRLRRWSVEPLLDRFCWTAEAAREFEHAVRSAPSGARGWTTTCPAICSRRSSTPWSATSPSSAAGATSHTTISSSRRSAARSPTSSPPITRRV